MKTFKKYVDERLMSTPQKVAQMQHYWDDLDHMASDDMKKKKMHPVLVVLLMFLFASCASNSSCPAFCVAYAYATIDENHVEMDTSSPYNLKFIESKSLEEKTKLELLNQLLLNMTLILKFKDGEAR